MTDFSIGDALGSGFDLIGRRPFSVVGWGLVYVLLGLVLPFGLMAAALGPDILDLVAKAKAGLAPAAAPPTFFPAFQARMMMVEPVLMLVPPIVQAVLAGAVFRAVLEPRNRGLGYLRLGRREFWLAVVLLVSGILAMMLLMAFEIGGGVAGLVLNAVFDAQHVEWPARIAVFAALGLVLLAIFLGICVRFSLALPMSFAEGHFRLFESWTLTRRRGWKLFGLAVLVGVISMVMLMLFEGLLVGAAFAAAAATHFEWSAWQSAVNDPQVLVHSGLAWWLLGAMAVFSFAMGAVFAVATAPWAFVYRALSATKPPSPREGGLYEPVPGLMPPEPGLGPLAGDGYRDPPSASHDHGHADPHGDVAEDGHGHHDPDADAPDDRAPGPLSTQDHGHEDHGHDEPAPEADGHDDPGHDDDGHGGGGHR